MTEADCEVVAVGPAAIVALTGEVDYSNVEAVERDVADGLREHEGPVVIDLAEVGYLDSSGIRMLFTFHRSLGADRRPFVVVVPEDSPLRRLLKVSGVAELIDTAPGRTEALGVLGSDELG